MKGEVVKEYIFNIVKIAVSSAILIVALLIKAGYTVKLILSIIAVLTVGYEIIFDCVKNVIKGEIFDENFLMLIASVVAFILGEYFEGVIIIILFSLGELLEEFATDNSRKKISELSQMKEVKARVLDGDNILEVSPENVKTGSVLELRKGDTLLIDGITLSDSEFDFKTITGESRIYDLKKGDKVYGGGINVGERIYVKTTVNYRESTTSKIISMVEECAERKAKAHKFINKFARIYTPIVVALAVAVAVIPSIFLGEFTKWLYKSLSFLVVSCPCALVISVPLTFYLGIGGLSKNGILVKGGNYIEYLAKTRVVLFDKTGTVTNGTFTVEKIIPENIGEDEFMPYVYATEKGSNHPISSAVIKYCEGKYESKKTEKFSEFSGKGISAVVEGKEVSVGNFTFISKKVDSLIKDEFYGTVLYVAIDNVYCGKIYLTDNVKDSAFKTIKFLRKLGIDREVILSGDNVKSVKNVADKLGIKEYYGELLPSEKLDIAKKIKDEYNEKTVFCGDGINDAPVLALSDVGIAMGTVGSDVAIDNADVVIMDDDLNKIPIAIKHSRKILRIVKENIFISLFVKFVIMICSLFFNLPLFVAVLGDVGVMLITVLSSMRSYNVNKKFNK